MSWIGPLIRRCRTNKGNGRSYGLGTGPDEVIVHKVACKTWQITLISELGWMPTVVDANGGGIPEGLIGDHKGHSD